MMLQIFCVHDRQAAAFANPMFMLAPGQAIRSFTDEVNRPGADNPLFNHPDDFDLWFVGQFDTSTGRFSELNPEVIALGKNVKLNGSISK